MVMRGFLLHDDCVRCVRPPTMREVIGLGIICGMYTVVCQSGPHLHVLLAFRVTPQKMHFSSFRIHEQW
jgi:hypothetical protein